jgi:hypothetical protein
VQEMAQVFYLGGLVVWPHDLPVKFLLDGQIDFERDKVGDTDHNTLFIHLFSSCATLMVEVPQKHWKYVGKRSLKMCLCLSKNSA